jgi:hypothetical protein
MASWWRRIKISAVFHLSSRRDRHSHAATRVIRRNTNRRHMIGDHHGRTAGRATLLVRAVDEILGTHTDQRIPQSSLTTAERQLSHSGRVLARHRVYRGEVLADGTVTHGKRADLRPLVPMR